MVKFDIIFLLIVYLLINSCRGEIRTDKKDVSTDSIVKSQEDSTYSKEAGSKNTLVAKIDGKLLDGIWAENEEDNALFFIKGDSLYYVEQMENPVKIEISNDTLSIQGSLPTVCKIIKLTEDSLCYKSEFSDEITRLYRR